MKRPRLLVTATVLSAVAATVSIFACARTMKPDPQKNDKQGHLLTALWSDYDLAVSKDRPKKQEEILLTIRQEASRLHYAWDFYDAGRKYIDAALSRNWKLRDSVRQDFAQAVTAFDDPIVNVEYAFDVHGSRTAADVIRREAGRLARQQTPVFYTQTGRSGNVLGGALPRYIRNDYEYALWALCSSDYNLGHDLLKKEVDGTYPAGAWLEYMEARRTPVKSNRDPVERKAALEALRDKYAGRAIAFYPQQDLLSMRKDSLDRAHAPSADYQALYQACLADRKARQALSGEDALITAGCKTVDSMIEDLTGSDLNIWMEHDTVCVSLKNLKSVQVSVFKDEAKRPLLTRTLDNSARSFYVRDTVRTVLPRLSDGNYTVYAKKNGMEVYTRYLSYTLSAAFRRDSRGFGIYLTDYRSGEPLPRTDLTLLKSGKELASIRDFRLQEGFTPLPASLTAKMKEDTYYDLVCSVRGKDGIERRTQTLSLNGNRFLQDENKYPECRYANLYTDRGAYNPGDTVHFKGILYDGDLLDKIGVVPAGVAVTVKLSNAQGQEVASKDLKTNEFGSVSSSFDLPVGLRNGIFRLTLSSGGRSLAERSLRVDEFVLPTFEVQFDKTDVLYLPGDVVEVRGRIESYTGHALSSAKVAYRTTAGSTVLAEGDVVPAADGSFLIRFPSQKEENWQYCLTEVTVTDETGETHTYSHGIGIGTWFSVSLHLHNGADADFSLLEPDKDAPDGRRSVYGPASLLLEDTARFTISVNSRDGLPVPMDIRYTLSDEAGQCIESGTVPSGSEKTFDLSARSRGLYILKAQAAVQDPRDGSPIEAVATYRILKAAPGEKALDGPVEYLFLPSPEWTETGEEFSVQVGTTDGPLWVVAELYGENCQLLASRLVRLDGRRGQDGSLARIGYEYQAAWPDAVRMQLFYFKNGRSHSYERQFRRVRHTLDLPLAFSTFEDKTFPASEHTFRIRTEPGVECLAAVFDKSTETIAPNFWGRVSLRQFNVRGPYITSVCGTVGEEEIRPMRFESAGRGGGLGGRLFRTKAANSALGAVEMVEEEAVLASPAAVNGAVMEDALADAVGDADGNAADVAIRENFSNTLAFEPFLRSDARGEIDFTFRTSDKLSTYVVALYAHSKEMKNNTLRREMLVSVPARAAIAEPRYLYSGDTYRLGTTVSSLSDTPVSGTLTLYQYDGKDYRNAQPVGVQSVPVTVPAGGSVAHTFPITVPQVREGCADLGLKLVFSAKDTDGRDFSDGLFVSIPVYPAAQTLTEAHSAVWLSGMDKEAVLEQIRKAFTGTTPYGAVSREISVLDMVRDAIPGKVEPAGKDVLSLSEAWYVRLLARHLSVREGLAPAAETAPDAAPSLSDEELLERILACRNDDGGFAWIEGLSSSPVVTAVLLERLSKLTKAGLIEPMDLTASVKYLDKNQFDYTRPYWCGGLSVEQYLYVRSLYPSVPFAVSSFGLASVFNGRMAEFRKFTKDYLVPKKARGLNGAILAKARRLKTLSNLLDSPDGIALAGAWGVTFGAEKKIKSSLADDVASLLEYAVDHRSGGMYYPNAVMPWRGLLESEAYAHSLISDLMADEARRGGASAKDADRVAEGTRLWLMLQKETQKWDEEPAFVDAVASILSGSEALLQTRVITLTKTYEKPFRDIRAAGNGMKISRQFFRERTADGKVTVEEVQSGAQLQRGDKLTVRYTVWNEENRSFVRIRAPREATLLPVRQLSGFYGWGIRPLRVNGAWSFTPSSYRDVKADRTEYYFDTYPEETTTVSEEFYVTQSGTFTAPVVEIESMYAPHYRANSAFGGALTVR